MMLYLRKAMAIGLLFILFISLFSAFAGELSHYDPELIETAPQDGMGVDSGDIRGTRADSDSVSLVTKPLFGSAQDVHVVGDYAYLVAGWSLLILDISDTSDPQLLGYYDSPGEATGVYVEGDYAYLAIPQIGLDVVDISDPTSPVSRRTLGTDGMALDTFVSGSYVYVAESTGFEIFEISSPENPVWVEKFDTDGSVYHITIDGDYAYVPSIDQGFLIVDVSTPSSPTLEGINDTYANPSSPMPRDVFVSEPYAYVADYFGGLVVFDITDKTDPQGVAAEATQGYPWEIKLDGSYAFIADEDEGLAILDISQPDNPSHVTNHNTPGNGDTKSVFIQGQNAVLADDLYGLKIVDISVPSNPGDEGSWEDTGFGVTDVQIVGNYAYVADFEAGIKILDVTNPSNPNLVGVYDTDGYAWALKVVGNNAYVADRMDGLKVINIANPSNPTQAWSIGTNSETYDVDVSGSYAYLADYHDGLRVIDINTRTEAGSLNTDGNAYSVQVEGDIAYVGDGDGLLIVNISDPTSPQEMGFYEIIESGYASMSLHVSGSYAYVGTAFTGMYIIDITDPTNPTLVGSFEEVLSTMGVQALGTTVYHTDFLDGLTVIGTSTLSDPQKLGYYNASGVGISVTVSGSYAYLSAASGGLYIFDIGQVRDTTSPSVSSVVPSNGENGVLGNSSIKMTFSENMDHDSVEKAFSITPSISGTFAWNGNTLSFTPDENLTASTAYSITIRSNANDTAGNSLPNDYSWQFQTYTLPPIIESVSPQPDSNLVSTDASVIMNFSKSMDFESIKTALSYNDGDVDFESTNGQLIPTNGDKTMTFTPFVQFQYDTAYTFTVNHSAFAADGAFLDGDNDGIGGEGSEDDYTWSFTTIPSPPQIISTYPEDGVQKIPKDAALIINFSKPMDKASVQNAFNFTNGTSVWDASDGAVAWSNGNTTFTFTPSSYLQYMVPYQVTVSYEAMDFQGLYLDGDGDGTSGEILEDSYTWGFTTAPSVPTITAVFPQAGSTLVRTDTSVIINFSKSMDTNFPQDANAFNYTDGISTKTAFNGQVVWSNDDGTLTFTPFGGFENFETYTFIIAHTAIDAEGAELDGDNDGIGGEDDEDDYSWSFTTMPYPPQVTSTVPSNYAQVEVDSTIEIKFTKSMNQTSVANAFRYTNGTSTWDVYDGNVTWSGYSEMIFTPDDELEHGDEYTVYIKATARDTDGVTLDGNKDGLPEGVGFDDHFWRFTTVKKPPQVESFSPENRTEDVAVDVDIVITFDRVMNTRDTEKAFSFTHDDTSEDYDISAGEPAWTQGDKTLTFQPYRDLEEGRTYSIRIDNTAKDADGMAFGGVSWHFTTRTNSQPKITMGIGVVTDIEKGECYFTILYSDEDNDEPDKIRVFIDDNPYGMGVSSDQTQYDYAYGKSYEFTIELESGEYTYYFEASDGKDVVSFREDNKLTIEVPEVPKEEDKVLGIFEEEYLGMPTMICGPIGLIILIVLLVSVMLMVRKRRAGAGADGEMMSFETFDEGGAAPITFMAEPEDEIMSFSAFEETISLEDAIPVVIQCPECDAYLKVRTVSRPFKFPCKCGAGLVLR